MSATRARMSLTALVVFAVASAGCGTGRDERSIGAVTDRFYEALRAHAGTRACNQLSKGASDALESASGQACEQAITDLTLPGVGAARSAVYEDSGRVEVAGASRGETVFLDRTSRGWRISAAGCRPQGDGPYDCELEG